MSNLIQDIKKDFREFWELPITQDGAEYRKTDYDSVNASLLFERLAESGKSDDLVIVSPYDPTFNLMLIIESLLSLLKYDMLTSSSKILSTIKPGDTVGLMQNRKMVPGIYTGNEEAHGAIEFYCVKTSDGVTTKIPPARSKWRIQPYLSSESNNRKRSAIIFGEALEELIGLPPGGVMAFQRSKALLVTAEKGSVIEAIRGVRIGDDPIEAIFPMSSFTDSVNNHLIGGNSLGRDSLLGLVANADTAVDIALSDPAIKLVIIDGASKIRSAYGSIERLNSDSEPRKIICILKPTDEEEIKTLSELDIDAWIWKRQDFQDMTEANGSKIKNINDPFLLHDQVINYLSGPDPETFTIESPLAFDDATFRSIQCIRTISRNIQSEESAGLILRWAISIINSMLQLPLSVNDYYKYLSTLDTGEILRIDNKLNALQNKIRSSYGFAIPSTQKDTSEELIKQLWNMYDALKLKNPKAEALNSNISEHKDKPVSVICCQREYANAFRSTTTSNGSVRVISMNDAGARAEENAIVTGWQNRRLAAKLFLAPYKNLTYILYPREVQSYTQIRKSHPASPSSVVDNKLRKTQLLDNKHTPEPISNTGESDSEIEALLNAVNQKFGTPTYAEHLQTYANDEVLDARKILFEDDSCAYATENHSFYKLERSSRSAQKCKVADINPGDELMFVDSERDMFEDLLTIIQQSENYKSLFEDARLWHRSLESYMNDNNINDMQLSQQLALIGCKPGPATLKAWINGSLISPAEDNLRALARVINSTELNSKLNEVMNACSKLYALHIQTGRLLVRRIVNAAAQEDEVSLNDETKARIEAYSQSASVVTVKDISENTLSIPMRAIGKLFEA